MIHAAWHLTPEHGLIDFDMTSRINVAAQMVTDFGSETGKKVPQYPCFGNPGHPIENVRECPECHRFFCPECLQSHSHSSDELYLAAQKLKSKYPLCRNEVDKELARLRERSRRGEFRSVAVQEIIIDLMSTIERLPCAQKRRRRIRGGSKRSYKR